MHFPHYLRTIGQERERRVNGRHSVDLEAVNAWQCALDAVGNSTIKGRLVEAYEYARRIDYKHDGLTSEIYLTHPIRVATLALLSRAGESGEVGVLGLLHNAFEVANVTEDELAERFGSQIADQIRTLTVDRKLQWDPGYKTAYYAAIRSSPIACRVVKIFDKLDNVFVLGLNRDDGVRTRYLEEIEGFVLPMVSHDVPELSAYFVQLVADAKLLGFFGDSTSIHAR